MKNKSKTGKNKSKKNKTRKGGVWPFNTSEQDSEYIKKCNNTETKCDTFDSQITNKNNITNKINPTWKTCINMNKINNHIIYITPENVAIKSIETLQIPEFTLSINNETKKYKIQIEDKYISCFLLICGEWYVMMRLFGKTLNTGYTARTEKNRVFFKLSNIKFVYDENGSKDTTITIPNENYVDVELSTKLSTSNSPTIQLKDCFENIDKKNSVFNVLQRFRQQKLFANSAKNEAATNSVDGVFSWIF